MFWVEKLCLEEKKDLASIGVKERRLELLE
jgi:hypothetical protein